MDSRNPLTEPASPVSAAWQRAQSVARARLLVCSDSTLESRAAGSEGGSGSGQLQRPLLGSYQMGTCASVCTCVDKTTSTTEDVTHNDVYLNTVMSCPAGVVWSIE